MSFQSTNALRKNERERGVCVRAHAHACMCVSCSLCVRAKACAVILQPDDEKLKMLNKTLVHQ